MLVAYPGLFALALPPNLHAIASQYRLQVLAYKLHTTLHVVELVVMLPIWSIPYVAGASCGPAQRISSLFEWHVATMPDMRSSNVTVRSCYDFAVPPQW